MQSNGYMVYCTLHFLHCALSTQLSVRPGHPRVEGEPGLFNISAVKCRHGKKEVGGWGHELFSSWYIEGFKWENSKKKNK